ncbi:MAG: thioredoxin domain-containing protein [Deltaproteobacteria bacterium]|nr:thioredoxin domain-containing protein [Deltaproteobacteria bacterium]
MSAQTPSAQTPSATGLAPSSSSTAILVLLGALNAMWAVFLWGELLLTRAGGTAFCAMSEKVNCSQLWDGPFASAIHSATRVPIAGWGLIFGLMSFALPLFLLVQSSKGQTPSALITAIRILGAAGALTVVLLLGISAKEGALCIGCLLTYFLVAGYAYISLVSWKEFGFDDAGKAIGQSAAFAGILFLAMLYPGMGTPSSTSTQTKDMFAAQKNANGTSTNANANANTNTNASKHNPPAKEHAQPHAAAGGHGLVGAPAGDVVVDEARIRQFMKSLPPQALQSLSDSLHTYRTSKVLNRKAPRNVMGPNAALTVIDWTDIRCRHCSQLHEVLAEIYKSVAKGSFNVESRHFPLDGNCNKGIQRRSEDGFNCKAAKAQICMEKHGDALFEYAGLLFKNQRTLDEAGLYKHAAKWMTKAELAACIEDPATEKKLQDDIAYALESDPEGTPVVIVNGRKANGYPPFVFALILAQGNANLEVFKSLPTPKPNAHVH